MSLVVAFGHGFGPFLNMANYIGFHTLNEYIHLFNLNTHTTPFAITIACQFYTLLDCITSLLHFLVFYSPLSQFMHSFLNKVPIDGFLTQFYCAHPFKSFIQQQLPCCSFPTSSMQDLNNFFLFFLHFLGSICNHFI